LLHMADDILYAGPSWATWVFFMERYCGILSQSLRSRSKPYANLSNQIFHSACLSQV
ncbi:hypothetical protein BT96DRAFT_745923, partial [Gymnopus androsaceus JB14]